MLNDEFSTSRLRRTLGLSTFSFLTFAWAAAGEDPPPGESGLQGAPEDRPAGSGKEVIPDQVARQMAAN